MFFNDAMSHLQQIISAETNLISSFAREEKVGDDVIHWFVKRENESLVPKVVVVLSGGETNDLNKASPQTLLRFAQIKVDLENWQNSKAGWPEPIPSG